MGIKDVFEELAGEIEKGARKEFEFAQDRVKRRRAPKLNRQWLNKLKDQLNWALTTYDALGSPERVRAMARFLLVRDRIWPELNDIRGEKADELAKKLMQKSEDLRARHEIDSLGYALAALWLAGCGEVVRDDKTLFRSLPQLDYRADDAIMAILDIVTSLKSKLKECEDDDVLNTRDIDDILDDDIPF